MLQNSLGDLCNVWDAMNNMVTLQHTEIRASFETSTHVVGHVFKKALYKSLLGMVSRYVLNQIAAEFERVHYAGNNPSSCGYVMRMTHDLPCACELSKYVVGCIPLDSIHMFWRRLSFSDQGIYEPKVSIKEEIKTISNCNLKSQQIAWGIISFKINFCSNNSWAQSYHVYKLRFFLYINKANSVIVENFSSHSTLKRKEKMYINNPNRWTCLKTVQFLFSFELIKRDINKISKFKILQTKSIHIKFNTKKINILHKSYLVILGTFSTTQAS